MKSGEEVLLPLAQNPTALVQALRQLTSANGNASVQQAQSFDCSYVLVLPGLKKSRRSGREAGISCIISCAQAHHCLEKPCSWHRGTSFNFYLERVNPKRADNSIVQHPERLDISIGAVGCWFLRDGLFRTDVVVSPHE